MIALVIVVFHEARQGALEFPRAKVLLELDDVLHRPVVAFDLSLRHGVIGRAVRALGLTVKKHGPPVRTRSA